MTETRNSSVKQKPHIPTISHMKKPPVSRGPARELGCCRGTYPPPAAGCMVTAFALDQKSRRRRCAPPPAALDGISIARFFGSKVQCSEQAEIFCDFPDKIPVPLLGSPLRDIEPQGCTKYSV